MANANANNNINADVGNTAAFGIMLRDIQDKATMDMANLMMNAINSSLVNKFILILSPSSSDLFSEFELRSLTRKDFLAEKFRKAVENYPKLTSLVTSFDQKTLPYNLFQMRFSKEIFAEKDIQNILKAMGFSEGRASSFNTKKVLWTDLWAHLRLIDIRLTHENVAPFLKRLQDSNKDELLPIIQLVLEYQQKYLQTN